MVNCKKEWFDDISKPVKNVHHRICPDLDRIKEEFKQFYILKGAYDGTVRISMATIIEVCQQN